MTDLRYPIGKVSFPEQVTAGNIQQWIDDLAAAPALLREAVAGLDAGQLDTPYREHGWTVRQVVHHMADSHINSYVRFRLALTEEAPAIKGYDENLWAELPDARDGEIGMSLDLLKALHMRWVRLLRQLGPAEWGRTLLHPRMGPVTLTKLLAIYAWHGRHHAAHITGLRQRNGWK